MRINYNNNCLIWGRGIDESLLYNTFLLLNQQQFMVISGGCKDCA